MMGEEPDKENGQTLEDKLLEQISGKLEVSRQELIDARGSDTLLVGPQEIDRHLLRQMLVRLNVSARKLAELENYLELEGRYTLVDGETIEIEPGESRRPEPEHRRIKRDFLYVGILAAAIIALVVVTGWMIYKHLPSRHTEAKTTVGAPAVAKQSQPTKPPVVAVTQPAPPVTSTAPVAAEQQAAPSLLPIQTELGHVKGQLDLLQQNDRRQDAGLAQLDREHAALEHRVAATETTVAALNKPAVTVQVTAAPTHAKAPAKHTVRHRARPKSSEAPYGYYPGGIPKPRINYHSVPVTIKK